MPQLLSNIRPVSITINNAGMSPLEQRPKLALLAMEGIATWATVESWLLNLYLDLAGGNKSIAAEMFVKLETNSARSAALVPLLARLDTRYQTLYRALAKVVRTRAKARDKLAHWVWGFSVNLPNALLLADPKALALVEFGPDYIERMREHVFMYEQKDFEQIIRDNNQLAGFGFNFRWIVQGHSANVKDQLYHELCAEPAIADILRRQDERDQSQPAAGE